LRRDVLVQRAAMRDVDDLGAAADAEHRQRATNALSNAIS
jgi:hypothetical protein